MGCAGERGEGEIPSHSLVVRKRYRYKHACAKTDPIHTRTFNINSREQRHNSQAQGLATSNENGDLDYSVVVFVCRQAREFLDGCSGTPHTERDTRTRRHTERHTGARARAERTQRQAHACSLARALARARTARRGVREEGISRIPRIPRSSRDVRICTRLARVTRSTTRRPSPIVPPSVMKRSRAAPGGSCVAVVSWTSANSLPLSKLLGSLPIYPFVFPSLSLSLPILHSFSEAATWSWSTGRCCRSPSPSCSTASSRPTGDRTARLQNTPHISTDD